MLLDNLISKNYYAPSAWIELISKDEGLVDLDQIKKFFGSNEKDIKNSLNNVMISDISYILSFISAHVRYYNPIIDAENPIYLTKFFLFEFFCNYLLERIKTDHLLEKNFIPIMQQAFLSKPNNDHDKEEKFQNIIIDVIAKYFFRKNIIPLNTFTKVLIEKKFLDLLDIIDQKNPTLIPELVKEKIGDYLVPLEEILYISDIITDPGAKTWKQDLERVQQKRANMEPNDIKEYNENLADSFKKLDLCFFRITIDQYEETYITLEYIPHHITKKASFLETKKPITQKTRDAFNDAKILRITNLQEESTKLMKKILNSAVKKALKFPLTQKKISEDKNTADIAIETLRISSPNSTPTIFTGQSNPTEKSM